MLALAGVVGGMILGEMAAGTRLGHGTGESTSYSRFSANPDALVPQGDGAAPCRECADSYGVALPLRAHREDRMSEEFRELGAIDVDPPLLVDTGDDYRYGGGFPDPEPVAAMPGEGPHPPMPARDPSPANKTAPAPAEY